MWDQLILQLDRAVRAVAGETRAGRVRPVVECVAEEGGGLSDEARRHAAGLMRVNHVGEVCAQALYQAQGLVAKSSHVRKQFELAAQEEEDHLAWCASRLRELHARPSLLNPAWYAGAFMIGLLAGKAGDAVSLGFVAETERQVGEHLTRHLEDLPIEDVRSRVILEQMRLDELHHGEAAMQAGGCELPGLIRWMMSGVSRVMTSTAYYL